MNTNTKIKLQKAYDVCRSKAKDVTETIQYLQDEVDVDLLTALNYVTGKTRKKGKKAR